MVRQEAGHSVGLTVHKGSIEFSAAGDELCTSKPVATLQGWPLLKRSML